MPNKPGAPIKRPPHKRLNPQRDAHTRDAIKATKIVERLQGFIFGEPDPTTKKPIVMSAQQVRAAEVLLRKVLPDLNIIDARDAGGDVSVSFVISATPTQKQQSTQEWLEANMSSGNPSPGPKLLS